MTTLRDVIDRFELPVRAGASGTDRPVRRVYLSESAGAMPWLLGGELVLTSGTALDPAHEDGQRRYVEQLTEAGVAGIGFGIGPAHRSIPPRLLAAAEAASLPVVEVPPQLPLAQIAVSVTANLLRVDAAESRQLASGIVALTSAARSGGPEGIVTVLAERVNGWAVLLDRLGRVRASVGTAQVHLDDARAPALRQHRRIRHPDLQVHPVGAADGPKAQLVVAARSGTISLARQLGAHAAVLIDLVLLPNAGDDLSGLARADAVDVLLSGDETLARTIAHRWGLTTEPLVAGRLRSRASQLNVHRHTLRHRIQRVEQLTGLSMAKSEDRFAAWLALRAHTQQQPPG